MEHSRTAAAGETLEIRAADGYPLAGTLYLPRQGKPRRLVILSAATGVPRRFYSRYAAHLAELGEAVLTYDYRGVAGSRPAALRGFEADLLDWVEDLGAVVDCAQRQVPETGVTLLGHSIGGVVSLLSPATGVERIVTLGAQVSYWRDWSWPQRFPRFLLWHLVFPLLTATAGYFPGRRFGLGEDLPLGFARQWARCWRGPRELLGELPTRRLQELSCQVVAVGITDDTIGTLPALRRLHELLPPSLLRYHWVEPRDHGLERLGHFDAFRRIGSPSVWKDLDRQILPEPSGSS